MYPHFAPIRRNLQILSLVHHRTGAGAASLLGSRQAGKTSLVRDPLLDALYLDFIAAVAASRFELDPSDLASVASRVEFHGRTGRSAENIAGYWMKSLG
jgi:hypothetical protein